MSRLLSKQPLESSTVSVAMRTWISRYWPLLAVLTAGFAVSGWIGVTEFRDQQTFDRQRFNLETRQVAVGLKMNMQRYEERLARFADHCATFDELPTKVWYFRRSLVSDLNGNLPAVMLAAYCPKVPASEFQAHAERARAVWAHYDTFDAARAPGRNLALPVWQRWARSGLDEIPVGLDLAAETKLAPSLKPMLAKATWSTARPSAIQTKDGGVVNGFWFGFTLFPMNEILPNHLRLAPSSDEFVRRANELKPTIAKAILAVFISAEQLIDHEYNPANRASRVHVRLYSSREPEPAALLNPVTQPPTNPRHREALVIPWYELRWRVEVTSTPFFEAESSIHKAWMFGVGGAGFTVLAAMLMGVSIRARSRQERLITEITEARNTLAATERARESLGDDLHDGAIQSLYAVQLGLTRTARNVADALPSAARVLDETRNRVDVVIAELRQLIHSANQRWSPDEAPPLDQVLASVVQSLRPTTTAEILLDAPTGAGAQLSSSQSVALAQLARSALGNALRHAEATQISVQLIRTRHDITLIVADDGKGFVMADREIAGHGIATMRKRAAERGGDIKIESAPGRGTRVSVRLWLSPEPTANGELGSAGGNHLEP